MPWFGLEEHNVNFMSQKEENKVAEVQITTKSYLLAPKEQNAFPVKVTEWHKIKRNVTRIIPHRRIFENLAYVCFGIFGSSLISLITFYSIEQALRPWVIPTFTAMVIGSLFLGIILLVLDNQQTKMMTLSTTKIIEEMEDLEGNYCLPMDADSDLTES
jgi:hypothetical protein